MLQIKQTCSYYSHHIWATIITYNKTLGTIHSCLIISAWQKYNGFSCNTNNIFLTIIYIQFYSNKQHLRSNRKIHSRLLSFLHKSYPLFLHAGYGQTSMSDRNPKPGTILQRVNPAARKILCHVSSPLSLPVVATIILRSNEIWASDACLLLDGYPITKSTIITFPFASPVEIASLARFKIVMHSSSLQFNSTLCGKKVQYSRIMSQLI